MTLPANVRALWRPPFVTVGPEPDLAVFVIDGRGDTTASLKDRDGLGIRDIAIPRGWGRIQYLPNGAEMMGQWETWWDANIPDGSTLERACELLNKAWTAP